jgi:hypothetical protein
MAAGCLAATALVTPFTILGVAPATATTGATVSSSVGADGDGMSGMTDPTPSPLETEMSGDAPISEPSPIASSPSEAPMHDMAPVTGDVEAPDMAGASHDPSATPESGDMTSPSGAADAHATDDGHGDEMTDMNSGDSAGHGGGAYAVSAPPEEQRKVVLAGFAAVNLLVFAGAGILRRMGHGSRSQLRAKQGPTTTPRRSGTATKDMGDQA